MNVRPDIYGAEPEQQAEVRKRPGLRLGGPWPVTIKIVLLKLFGLAILYYAVMSQLALREHAADNVLTALTVQADTLAALLDGGSLAPATGAAAPAPAIADRNAVERLLARVMEGSASRAEVWEPGGTRIADSLTALRWSQDVTGAPLPPLPLTPAEREASAERPAQAAVPAEVRSALGGVKTATRGSDADGDLVVAVATPVLDAVGAVAGALRVRSAAGAVLGPTRQQERAVRNMFGIAAVVLIINAIVIAALLNRRLVRLARAAERVKGGASAFEIPETGRSDTVGELASAFREMAISLTHRMAATEAFAAEVAHELKNPLTSLRSAVETLPFARTDRARDSLLGVIAHDVHRIDRLISDISDASRLDRELTRSGFARFDLVQLLQHVVSTGGEIGAERGQTVALHLRSPARAFMVEGNDSRLGQVFTNLLDNALSFTPDGGKVTVTAQRFDKVIEVVVDDEGPGMDETVLERIFERFYTDRPDQAQFGNNSGLGLAISRQIVIAHGGEIFAENRYRSTLGPERDVAGARFTVRLPVR